MASTNNELMVDMRQVVDNLTEELGLGARKSLCEAIRRGER